MADIAELIERLEKLTGPDREVDAAIYEALVSKPITEFMGDRRYDDLSPDEQQFVLRRTWLVDRNYTRSLDTVIALVERELPGWGHGYQSALNPGWFEGCLAAPNLKDGEEYYGIGRSPALALLVTFLTAKDALLRAKQQEATDAG